ncbi:MAG: lysostaphin resistance A-like protein [Bacilli bacterium]
MYIKKLLKSLIPLYILLLLNPILLFIIASVYATYNIDNLTNFINNYGGIILILTNITYIIYIIKKHRIKVNKYNLIDNYPKIYLFISIPLFLNSLILLINNQKIPTINIYIALFGSVIIGPILEELVFRYLIYNNLNKFNKKNTSIILSSLIFALVHNGFINIVYAFIIGTILTIIYSKNKNIKEVIILHMVANLMSLLIKEYNPIILISSFLCLIFSLYIIKMNK